MTVIGTNIASLVASNASNTANSMLNTSMQRLSTGKRINSAKDDAAGLAISNSMTSQINGMSQATRNANDGISLAQTADGSLDEVTNMAQRIRELAVQSASGTYSDSDRTNMQAEVTQLTQQISSTLTGAQFNGVALFDTSAGGSGKTTSIQVGANSGDTVNITIGNLDLTSIAGSANYVPASANYAPASANYQAASANYQAATPAVTAQANGEYTVAAGDDFVGKVFTAGNKDDTSVTAGSTSSIHDLTEVDAQGNPVLDNSNNPIVDTQITSGHSYKLAAGDSVYLTSGTEEVAAKSQVGTAAVGTPAVGTPAVGTAPISVATAAGANAALGTVDTFITKVNTVRAGLGASESRLSSAVNTLTSNVTNLTAAQSQIQDTDFSTETANLAKAQILSQASTAMLAQANQSQQNVLSLLK